MGLDAFKNNIASSMSDQAKPPGPVASALIGSWLPQVGELSVSSDCGGKNTCNSPENSIVVADYPSGVRRTLFSFRSAYGLPSEEQRFS